MAIDSFLFKRIQRGGEYLLLSGLHVVFLISFGSYYVWWMALGIGLVTFGMNFQLTQLRERRRTMPMRDRYHLLADVVESILFLAFVLILSLGGLLGRWLSISYTEYLGYVAAALSGLFLAGLLGEIYWQIRHLPTLEDSERANYEANLHRTVILPYTRRRR